MRKLGRQVPLREVDGGSGCGSARCTRRIAASCLLHRRTCRCHSSHRRRRRRKIRPAARGWIRCDHHPRRPRSPPAGLSATGPGGRSADRQSAQVGTAAANCQRRRHWYRRLPWHEASRVRTSTLQSPCKLVERRRIDSAPVLGATTGVSGRARVGARSPSVPPARPRRRAGMAAPRRWHGDQRAAHQPRLIEVNRAACRCRPQLPCLLDGRAGFLPPWPAEPARVPVVGAGLCSLGSGGSRSGPTQQPYAQCASTVTRPDRSRSFANTRSARDGVPPLAVPCWQAARASIVCPVGPIARDTQGHEMCDANVNHNTNILTD